MRLESNNFLKHQKSIHLPIHKIKDFYGTSLKKPEVEALAMPLGKNQQNFLLNKWMSRLFGKKLLKMIQQLSVSLSYNEAITISEGVDHLFSFEYETIEVILRRPEFTSLLFFLEKAFNNQDVEAVKSMLPYLLNWFMKIDTVNNTLIFSKDGEWYKNYFPCKSGSKQEILFNMKDKEFEEWTDAMKDGLKIVKEVWIEAYEEILENIFQIMPINPIGLHPHNYSIHTFRGLISCAKRPDYMLAQSFVHETGHNKFSTIVDIYTLIDNKEKTTFISPFANEPRTFIPIFHGIFSFLEDLYISKRMISKVKEVTEGSLERYIKIIRSNVEEGLEIVRNNARLTEEGYKLYKSLENSYENL